jgi:hypothetical protein
MKLAGTELNSINNSHISGDVLLNVTRHMYNYLRKIDLGYIYVCMYVCMYVMVQFPDANLRALS